MSKAAEVIGNNLLVIGDIVHNGRKTREFLQARFLNHAAKDSDRIEPQNRLL